MAFVVFLIEQVAIGLYIFAGIALLLTLRRLGRANYELHATRFELQRDLARYARANALTTLVLLIEGILFVVAIQVAVAPTLRSTLDLAPQVQDVIVDIDFNTPTAAPLSQVDIDEDSVPLIGFDNNEVRITPTPTATPVGTIEPAPSPVGCTSPGAFLQIPANGQVIQSLIEVRGTAFTSDFATYKLEISGELTGGSYATMESYTQPVETLGVLSQFNPIIYEEGTYQFRLAVFDITDTLRESCSVTIYIRRTAPTPTPGGR